MFNSVISCGCSMTTFLQNWLFNQNPKKPSPESLFYFPEIFTVVISLFWTCQQHPEHHLLFLILLQCTIVCSFIKTVTLQTEKKSPMAGMLIMKHSDVFKDYWEVGGYSQPPSTTIKNTHMRVSTPVKEPAALVFTGLLRSPENEMGIRLRRLQTMKQYDVNYLFATGLLWCQSLHHFFFFLWFFMLSPSFPHDFWFFLDFVLGRLTFLNRWNVFSIDETTSHSMRGDLLLALYYIQSHLLHRGYFSTLRGIFFQPCFRYLRFLSICKAFLYFQTYSLSMMFIHSKISINCLPHAMHYVRCWRSNWEQVSHDACFHNASSLMQKIEKQILSLNLTLHVSSLPPLC